MFLSVFLLIQADPAQTYLIQSHLSDGWFYVVFACIAIIISSISFVVGKEYSWGMPKLFLDQSSYEVLAMTDDGKDFLLKKLGDDCGEIVFFSKKRADSLDWPLVVGCVFSIKDSGGKMIFKLITNVLVLKNKFTLINNQSSLKKYFHSNGYGPKILKIKK